MQYIRQAGMIFLFTFLGELLSHLIPLPIPAAIWGLLLLFLSLCIGIVKLEQLQACSRWLVAILPVLFVAPTVNLMEQGGALLAILPAVCVCIVLSTALTFLVAGRVTQRLGRREK